MMQLVYTSLLLIVTLWLTCGEREIRSTIKKSQNIMTVGKINFHYHDIDRPYRSQNKAFLLRKLVMISVPDKNISDTIADDIPFFI